jgi:hypothetical protein
MRIIIKLQAGIIYFKQCDPTQTNLHLLFEQKIGNLYNKSFLTNISILQKLNRKKIFDIESNHISSVSKFKSKILLTYPYVMHSKSKYIMPLMIEKIIQIFSNYNEMSSIFSINDGFYNFELIGLPLSGHDKKILKLLLSTLNEEVTLIINEKISSILEINYDKDIPFNLLFNKFIRYNDSTCDLINKFEIYLYFRLSNNEQNVFFYFDNNRIIKKDINDKEKFEAELCEYYLFINEIYNMKDLLGEITFNLNNLTLKTDSSSENNENQIFNSLNYQNNNNQQKENNDLQITKNNNFLNHSVEIIEQKKKSSLKPFDSSQILIRSNCKIDWGNTFLSKTEIRKRNQNIKATILRANKELESHYEKGLINNSFIEDSRKVNFDIHYDKDLVLSRLSQKLFSNYSDEEL